MTLIVVFGPLLCVETPEQLSRPESLRKTDKKQPVKGAGQGRATVQLAGHSSTANWTPQEKALSKHDVSAEGVTRRLTKASQTLQAKSANAWATKSGRERDDALLAAQDEHDQTASKIGITTDAGGKRRIIDLETGEQGTSLIIIAPRSKSGLAGGFVLVSQAMAEQLANTGGELSPNAWRLLMLCLGKCDFENVFDLNISAIAKRWEVSRTTITSARDQLVKAGVVRVADIEVGGHRYRYALDPEFLWKGREGGRKRALRVVS